MSFPVETDQDNKITYTFNQTEPDSVVLLTKDVEKFLQKYQNSVQTNFTTVDEAKRLNLMKRAMIKQNLNRQKIIKSFFEIAL